jgi:pre-mRNA-splicing factor 38A
MRLTGSSLDVHKYLEPLYVDYRKMKRLNRNGQFEMVHMDEMIDSLLHGERVCDVALPRLQKRHVLEELNQLELRISPLEENLDDVESSESEEEVKEEVIVVKNEKVKSSSSHRSGSRDRSPSVKRERRKYVDYDNPESPKEYKHRSSSPSKRRRSSNERKDKDSHRSSHRHHDSERDHERKHHKKHKHKRSRSRSKDKSEDLKKSRDKKEKSSK